MMEYKEEDYLLLSGIQHFVFCRRQWALIHIEQQWKENYRTIEGEILHEKAHDGTLKEKRGELIISRGMGIFSKTMGLTGACDIVELHRVDDGVSIFGREGLYKPIPVEYKRGKPKENGSDEIQLCAQAICLEEMLLCKIPEAYLYYGEIQHRLKVILSDELKEKVRIMAKEMHDLFDRRHTPKVKLSKNCKACSLAEICIPALCKNPSAASYIQRSITELEEM